MSKEIEKIVKNNYTQTRRKINGKNKFTNHLKCKTDMRQNF